MFAKAHNSRAEAYWRWKEERDAGSDIGVFNLSFDLLQLVMGFLLMGLISRIKRRDSMTTGKRLLSGSFLIWSRMLNILFVDRFKKGFSRSIETRTCSRLIRTLRCGM